jgi:hypothetical protein
MTSDQGLKGTQLQLRLTICESRIAGAELNFLICRRGLF